jgi:hypothetical protein
MADSQNTTAITVAVLQQQVKTLTEVVEDLKQDRDSAVRWGLITLGTAVVGLGGWVFNLIQHALKLTPN